MTEPQDLSRREFLRLLGASAALATACTRLPRERILPYVTEPPELIPGVPLHYATAMELDGYATGLLVESHEGRPTKIEGNPDHPASLGAAGPYEQASVLGLYDPDRARRARVGRRPATWEEIASTLVAKDLADHVGARGAGLHILLEPTSSVLVASLVARVRAAYPEAHVHVYAPLAYDAPLQAAQAVFGAPLQPLYDFQHADIVIAIDADFLSSGPFHLRYAREFSDRHHVAVPTDNMTRLYVAEPAPTPTGSVADHRLRWRASGMEQLLRRLIGRMQALDPQLSHILATPSVGDTAPPADALSNWVDAVAHDLHSARGHGAVIVGQQQSAATHALAYLLNAALGNAGSTVWYIPSVIHDAEQVGGGAYRGLQMLAEAVDAHAVNTLVVLGGNPAYTAPTNIDFKTLLRAVPRTVYLGLYENETAQESGVFIPAAHYLESWGDVRAYDGTLSIVQPLIAPLYDGKTPAEVLAAIAGTPADAHTLVRAAWHPTGRAVTGDAAWEEALRRGVVPNSAARRAAPGPRTDAIARIARPTEAASEQSIEITFRGDPSVYDGRFANNAWLQELPDPLTTLTWGNAALLSPATASRLGTHTGELLRVSIGNRALDVPALVVPGHVDESLSLRFGYGRAGSEQLARDVGVNVYTLWTSATGDVGFASVARVLKDDVPLSCALAMTQLHWRLEGRPIVQHATLEEYRRDPDFAARPRRRTLTIYEPRVERGDQWAMTIDLSLCTGCGACVVACQAENNVPVVGAQGVREAREMHWLRVDRYFEGDLEEPSMIAQPMLCQHCEQAPCEYVCPVNATVHSDDGLNEMVYNRCVGTRFCSNNCPYKVRRFNWFDYNAGLGSPLDMVENPNVTVRDRGVMEKCTFCVQRIRQAQIDAEVAGRPVRDGDVRTACQQACPTQAIVFGSRTDPRAQVTERLAESRSYAVLDDLGTMPRVRYLARITNPNPTVAGDAVA